MHLFYQPLLKNEKYCLENEEFHHCVQVLRHKPGDHVHVTDGLGSLYEVELTYLKKKVIDFSPVSQKEYSKPACQTHIVISPTKQMERMEWFVEKACEIGVDKITFVETKNSERRKLKLDRLEKKTISALKQSKSAFKTELQPLIKLETLVGYLPSEQAKFIAYVDDEATSLVNQIDTGQSNIIMIGPEGDFTPEEILLTEQHGFSKVSLGSNVLRTETAGIYALAAISVLKQKKGD